MGVETAIIGGGVLGGVGSVIGSGIQAGAARDAAGTQLQGTRESIAAQKEANASAIKFYSDQAAIARNDLAPVREAQAVAIEQLRGLSDPNNAIYQQQRQQATQQIQMQLAAQGLLRSKNQTDLLSNLELGLNQSRVGVLQGLAGLGGLQSSAGVSQGLGQTVAGLQAGLGANIGSSLQGGANAAAQGIMGVANAQVGGLQGLTNAFQGTASNLMGYQNNQSQLAMLNRLLGGGSTTGVEQISAGLANTQPLQLNSKYFGSL